MATLYDGVTTLNLGIVNSERQTKSANLFVLPMPLNDSTDSFLIDIFGTQKNITLDCKIVGTISELRTFISAMESFEDGDQGTGFTYQSELISSTINVFIDNFDWDWKQGETSSLSYSLTLIEGTQ